MNHNYNIENNEIELRPVKKEDIESLYEYTTDKLLPKYMLWEANTSINNYKKVINKAIEEFEEGSTIQLVIIRKTDNKIVGVINIYNTHTLLSSIFNKGTIGLWIARCHQGKGYGKQALELVIKMAFSRLNLNKLIAYVFEDDVVSYNLFSKRNFQVAGLLKNELFKNEKWNNVYLFELLNDGSYSN